MFRAVSLVSGLVALGGSMPAQVEPSCWAMEDVGNRVGYGTRVRRSRRTAASNGVMENTKSP